MIIDKAIEILQSLYARGMSPSDPNPREAFLLGLEALKRIKAQRGPGGEIGALGLPGETED